jgi:hypothetical protein
LLVVLFFVSVYGVKEGFANQCVAGNTYSEPTVSSDGKYLAGCYTTNTCKVTSNNMSKYRCYSGTPNSKNKLTSFSTYSIIDGKVVKK